MRRGWGRTCSGTSHCSSQALPCREHSHACETEASRNAEFLFLFQLEHEDDRVLQALDALESGHTFAATRLTAGLDVLEVRPCTAPQRRSGGDEIPRAVCLVVGCGRCLRGQMFPLVPMRRRPR